MLSHAPCDEQPPGHLVYDLQDAKLESRRIEIGDSVVLAYNDEPSHQRTIRISADLADPDMGILHKDKPISRALLGAEEEEELEIPAGGASRTVTIMHIEKRM